MKLEKILKEFGFGEKVRILDLVNSGVSKGTEISRSVSLCDSTVRNSLEFLTDEGFLRREVEKSSRHRWKLQYFITKKGTELTVLLDKIKVLCDGD